MLLELMGGIISELRGIKMICLGGLLRSSRNIS